MESLYPDDFDFKCVSDVYPAGQDSTIQAGVASVLTSSEDYDVDGLAVCFVCREEGSHRFRVMSPTDIDTVLNGLTETRDTRNNCELCFTSISSYKGGLSDFDVMVQLRSFDESSSSEPYVKRTGVRNCEACQIGLEKALNDVVEEASSLLVVDSL